MSDLAPIVLFIFKRPRHTAETLKALAANGLARESQLIIFSDGPRHPEDVAAVEETRSLARSLQGFSSVRIIAREDNAGLANSVIAGVSEIMSSHGRAIVLEDDIVTSPHFLSYMNGALNRYREDPHVFSVTGYTFPPASLVIPEDYPWDTYSGYRCSSWGWGCWESRWKTIDWDMKYYTQFMRSRRAKDLLNRGGPDLTRMLRLQKIGKIDSWAIRFAYAHYAAEMRCIYPVKSLTRNIGLDNSGTHTGESPVHTHIALDNIWQPVRFCPSDPPDEEIARRFYIAATPPKVSLVTRIFRKVWRILRSVFH